MQLRKATAGQEPASTQAYVLDLPLHALASDEQSPARRQQLAASLAELLGTLDAFPNCLSQRIFRNQVGTQLRLYHSWHDMVIKEDIAVKGIFMQPVHAYARAFEISNS